MNNKMQQLEMVYSWPIDGRILTLNMLGRVAEMHDLFGHPVNHLPVQLYETPESLIDFRRSLIDEEYKETKNALNNFDVIEVVDGVCDLMVVSLGYHLVTGSDIQSTTTNYDDSVAEEGSFGIVDFLQNHEQLVRYINDHHHLTKRYATTLLSRQIIRDFYFMNRDNPKLMLEENFDRVMENNMSKAPLSRESAAESQNFYKEEKGVNCHIQYIASQDRYAILRDDGKILKPLNWQPPQIEVHPDLLTRHIEINHKQIG